MNQLRRFERKEGKRFEVACVDRDQEAKMNGFAWRNGRPPYGYQEELGSLNLQCVNEISALSLDLRT